MTEFTLHISGMHCASCVGKVEAALANVDGIDQVAVNLAAFELLHTLLMMPPKRRASAWMRLPP